MELRKLAIPVDTLITAVIRGDRLIALNSINYFEQIVTKMSINKDF